MKNLFPPPCKLFLIATICFFNMQLLYAQLAVTVTASNYNGSNISCFGSRDGSITANTNGGTPPYTYYWTNGQSTQTATALAAGYYRVKVFDSHNDMVYAEVTLTEPEALSLEPAVYTYPNGYNISCWSCNNGIIDIYVYNGTPPYTFLWADGNTNQSRTNLSPGSHAVSVTDANGCTLNSEQLYLTEPARSDWTTIGNTGSNPSTNFIGTTDNKDLVFKTNNSERLRMKSNGDVKIGSLANNGLNLVYADSNGILRQLPIGLPPPYNPTCNSRPFYLPWMIGTDPNGAEVFNCWQRFGFGTDTPHDLIEVKGDVRVTNYQNSNKFIKMTHNGSQGNIDATQPLWLNGINNQDVYVGSSNTSTMSINSALRLTNGVANGLIQADAQGNVTSSGVKFSNGFGSTAGILSVDGSGSISTAAAGTFGVKLWQLATNSADINNSSSGNVGIGTNNPLDRLQVNNGSYKLSIGAAGSSDLHYGTSYIGFNAARVSSSNWLFNSDYEHNGGSVIWTDVDGNIYFSTIKSDQPANSWTNQSLTDQQIGNNKMALKICNNGVVSIGTSWNAYFDQSKPYKLYVKGGIRTEKVKVDVASQNGWADFVFNKEHKKLTIEEVENYIKQYSHLPNIPTYDEVSKNGVDLGEMNKLLLEKIEELTLYLIEPNKKIKTQH